MRSIIEVGPNTFNPSKAWRPQLPMIEMGKLERVAVCLGADLIQVVGTYHVMVATTWQDYCTLVGTADYIARKLHADERIVRALLNEFWRESQPGEWINPELSATARDIVSGGQERAKQRAAKKDKKRNEISDPSLESRTNNRDEDSSSSESKRDH